MTTATLNLFSLSGPKPLFSDQDGDGYPDRVHYTLGLTRGMDSGPVWAGLINLAARLSIESCGPAIAAPVVRSTPAAGMLLVKKPNPGKGPAARLEKTGPDSWQLTGCDPLAMKQMLDSLAAAETVPDRDPALPLLQFDPLRYDLYRAGMDECQAFPKNGTPITISLSPAFPAAEAPETDALPTLDLTSLVETILIPDASNLRARELALGLVLPDTLSPRCGLALFSLVTAAASRATTVTLPVAGLTRPRPGALCLNIEEDPSPGATFRQEKDHLNLKGRPRDLAALIEALTRLWFEADAPGGEKLEAWKNRLNQAATLASGKDEAGRILYRLVQGNTLPPIGRQHWPKAAAACRRLDLPVPDKKPVRPPLIRQTALPDEAQAILDRASKIPQGRGPVLCRTFTGGSRKTRLAFKQKLDRILKTRGYTPDTRVTRSHKPGVSWLLEEVAPQIPKNAQKLRISVCPFVRPDQMEPRARWIHELYPAPDILCRRRGWPVDRVEMTVDEGQKEAYRVLAYDKGHEEVGRFSLTPMVSALPYALKGRGDQVAYPVAAGFELFRKEDLLMTCPVPTDREVFWRRFQKRWLPRMEEEMKAMLADRLESSSLAFWEEIRIEVAIDDEQESLDFAQERIAPMEALHEDLYFGLLAFMEAFRQAHCPESRIQLGRILPVMRAARGEHPRAGVKLIPLQHPLTRPEKPPVPRQIGFAGGMLFADLDPASPPLSGEETARLCAAAKAWGFTLSPCGSRIRYSARPAAGSVPESIPAAPVCPPDLETIPAGNDVRQWTRTLQGRPGLRVWQAGQTLLGRDIPAVEAVSGRMTAGRARLLKPTLLVNARHHANEVSGTNAAMELLAALAAHQMDTGRTDHNRTGHDQTGIGGTAADLLARINLVVVPLENGDGVATLEEMLPEAPDHKLHAARYNALGMEWYDQYFEADTPFSEARVKARLFDRWLPAYIIDLHGVPSHEWEHPFAGYLPPGFEAHWIPRSFVYAILPFYGRTDHPGGRLAEQLAREMSESLEREREILDQNREVYTRYRRYAKAFDPARFDAGMAGALVVVPTSERISKTNFADRRWPLVRSEIVTEVLDEVACGPWLARCALAHKTVIRTLMAHMASATPARLTRRQGRRGLAFFWEREEA